MDWFYAENGQQTGPVNDTQLDELLSQGRIRPDTLVWRAGLDQWQPLQQVRSASASGLPPTSAVCGECQRILPQAEMVFLNRTWICAACKPLFLQRLREGAAPGGGALWRHKRHLIMRQETALPDRCVKCNEPAQGWRLRRRLYWHPSAYYLLILLNLLIYAIVAIIVRKRAIVLVPLCPKHRRRRVVIVTACWLAGLGGIALLVAGIANDNGASIGGGLLLVVVALLCGALFAPPVTPARIDKDFVRLRGVCPEFLEPLPEWEGPA